MDKTTAPLVPVYKRIMEAEADEPNFPEQFHSVIKYDVLRRLYESNPYKLQKYQALYNEKRAEIYRESRGTLAKSMVVKFVNTDW